MRLLASAGGAGETGRLAISIDDGPDIIPVNFAVFENEVIVRIGPGAFANHLDQASVAFEVDYAEAYSKAGWSVVVRGSARILNLEEVARLGRNLPTPLVMHPGIRVFSIRPDAISGRSIRHDHEIFDSIPWSTLWQDAVVPRSGVRQRTAHRSAITGAMNAAADTPAPHPTGSTSQAQPSYLNAGDIARRVAHRRAELGLSVEEVARRAGIDPGYLRYFEQSPNAILSAGTMLLVAMALDTSPIALSGGNLDRPPGHGRAGRHPVLEGLGRQQCEAHLSAGGIGRVVYSTNRGPIAVPVNFEFTAGEIIISTDNTKTELLEAQESVGFEIDRVDEAMSEGWSVLVTGRARRIDDPDEVQRLSSLDLEAWAGGDRHVLVGLRPDEITGRVIIHETPPDED